MLIAYGTPVDALVGRRRGAASLVRGVVAGAVLAGLATTADAQLVGEDVGAVGTQVRFRAPAVGGRWCEGRVTGLAADTVRVVPSRACFRFGSVPDPLRGGTTAELQVWDGDRGSRLRHVLLGSAVGFAVGAVVGRVASGDGCRVSPCDDGDFAALMNTIAGAGAGLLAGGLVGGLLPAGPRWVTAGPPRPVRAAGLVLRPGMRFALGHGRR